MLLDKDIREPLFEFLEEKLGKVRFLEEKMMGRSRADVIMITEDQIVGIEIKSDADTYARLKRQVPDYCIYFDCNYVVVGSSHGEHVAEHVPDTWGIITVERLGCGLDFYLLRPAKPNPKAKLENKLRLLWHAELTHILKQCGMPAYARKSRKFIAEKLTAKVPQEILQPMISEELFERDYTVYQ